MKSGEKLERLEKNRGWVRNKYISCNLHKERVRSVYKTVWQGGFDKLYVLEFKLDFLKYFLNLHKHETSVYYLYQIWHLSLSN